MSARCSEGWKTRLYHASRSRAFLWKFAVLAILTGIAVGTLLSRIEPSESYLFGERVLAHVGLAVQDDDTDIKPATETVPELIPAFIRELTNPALRFIDVISAIPSLAPFVAVADHEQLRVELNKRFSSDESALAVDYLAARDVTNRDAFIRVQNHATRPEPRRFARYIFGMLEMRRENYQAAYAVFSNEGQLEEARESRFMAVQALIEAKDFATLSALQEEPGYREFFTPHVRLEAAIAARDWLGISKTIPLTQIASYRAGILLVTLIAGISWALFLVHLGEVTGLFSRTAAVCTLGFVAGVISTTPTIFLVIVQDDILGFSAGEDVYRTFAYYIAGVGAREELCKLLLFAPLLPVLIKRDDELEALIVACFVGLGFAIEENGNYFMLSAAAGAPGRFLTANFFHIALTGLNGLALFRACTRGMSGVNDLMLVLPMTIIVHGVYDALLDVPEIEGGGFLAIITYILFSVYFFKRVHALRNNVRMTLGLTGSFVIGVSLLAGAVVAYQMAMLGAAAGLSLMFSELLGSGILLFMFFREFNEPLAP